MAVTEMVYELLKQDLCAERVLLDQVAAYITDQYGFTTAELDRFVTEKYPALEDYEVDLTFSPQFTPNELARVRYIPVLADTALSSTEVDELKRRLEAEKLSTRLKTSDGLSFFDLPQHEVLIARYVNLLNLDQPLPDESVLNAINDFTPRELNAEVNMLARDEVWRNEDRQQMLVGFLTVFSKREFTLSRVHFLTDFVRTYRPASLLDLGRQFQLMIDSCERDQETVNGRGFQDDFLKATHAGNRLNLTNERDVFERYQHMKDMAYALKADWEQFPEICPEIWQKAEQQQPV